MPAAYEGTDIISYLQRKYIIRLCRISYRVSDISLKSDELARQKEFGSLRTLFCVGGLRPNKPPVLPGDTKTLVYARTTSDDRMVMVWRPHYQLSTEVIKHGKERSKS